MVDDLKQWAPLDFARQIVQPGLEAIQHYDPAGMVLVLGTCIQESGLKYTHQIGGPALGYPQIEPATHKDLWCRWLGPTKRMYIIDGLRMLTSEAGQDRALVDCPQYAAAMCRCKYLSIPSAIPGANDIEGMAQYYKKYYNSSGGAATLPEAIVAFTQAVDAMGSSV